MARQRTQGGEQPEGAVDVQPRAVVMSQLAYLAQRIEIASVDVAGGCDHDRGLATQLIESRSQRDQVDAASRVAGQDLHPVSSQTQHPKGLDSARMQVTARA